MSEIYGSDAYSPKEIAQRVESVGVTKARLPVLSTLMLGILAGGFIGLGAMYFTLVVSDESLSFALKRVLGGVTFSLGLILVVIAGAELFTGNNLLVMARIRKQISTRELLWNWALVFSANCIGAMGLAGLVALSNLGEMNSGAVGAQMVKIAAAKTSLPFLEAFFKAILCNILVCLAVWISIAGRSVTDKILGILFPISAFVAAGFEHSVANMYFIPLGVWLKPSGLNGYGLNWYGMLSNLLPVTLGNLVGGALMVGVVYYVIYMRRGQRD